MEDSLAPRAASVAGLSPRLLHGGGYLVLWSYLLMFLFNEGQPPADYERPELLTDLSATLFLAEWIFYLTGLPGFVLIILMRWTKLPRGYSDAAAGALLAPALPPLYLFIDQRPDQVLQPSDLLNRHILILPAEGAPAALVYWLAAGRPRARRRS